MVNKPKNTNRVTAIRLIASEVAALDGHALFTCDRLADRAEGMLTKGEYRSPLDILNNIAALSASLSRAKEGAFK